MLAANLGVIMMRVPLWWWVVLRRAMMLCRVFSGVLNMSIVGVASVVMFWLGRAKKCGLGAFLGRAVVLL